MARKVGLGSLKYPMLARDNNKTVTFDLEEALSFDGHSAPYIQYAHARACRILENGGGIEMQGRDSRELGPEELSLLQLVAQFPEEVQRSAEQDAAPVDRELCLRPGQGLFGDFYHACPVVHSEEPLRSARLAPGRCDAADAGEWTGVAGDRSAYGDVTSRGGGKAQRRGVVSAWQRDPGSRADGSITTNRSFGIAGA